MEQKKTRLIGLFSIWSALDISIHFLIGKKTVTVFVGKNVPIVFAKLYLIKPYQT
jgi:hypothetical protein